MSKRLIVAAVLTMMLLAGAASGADTKGALDFANKTLALVERSAARPKLAAELKALERRFAQVKAERGGDMNALYSQVRRLRRRIILSHPLLDFDKLLINKRSSRVPGHMCDQYLGRHSRPSPGLVILESWKDKPKETLLLKDKLPPGNVLHPDLSFDAKRAAFSFCDTSAKDSKHRGFFIYEVEIDGGKVRQVTGTPADPLTGAKGRQTVLIEDLDPCYLPDGGFAFVSTRSQQFGRCHGSRYVPSYVLYRSSADGSKITRLSFNEANEWDPAVLNDGRIIYTRWDYINRHDTNFQSLWVTRADGTAVAHFYGNYSVGPCMIAEARAIPGSQKVVATATDHHGYTAGSIILIDPYKGQDEGAPLVGLTPEIGFPERRAPRGTTMVPVPLERLGGRAATPYPLSEDLFLIACGARRGKYAIYLIDTLGGRELIYQDPKISCFAPIPVRPCPKPPVVSSAIAGKQYEKTGQFFIQDVYQSTQPIDRGTIKALRVSEIISQPTRAKPRLSRVDNEIIKKILGTVPIHEDGSVVFEVPACTPLQFQVLDGDGMAVMTMRSLVYVMPGERAGCVGCHEPRENTPVPINRGSRGRVRKLRPPAGPSYAGGFSFQRTVQPVLDRYCIGCHGLGKTEGKMSLIGVPSTYNQAYDMLMKKGVVKIAQRNQETPISKPRDYFAHAGRLAKMLLDGHKDKQGKPRVKLDKKSFERIVNWLDLNAQFYGDYSFNRAERQPPSQDGEKRLRQHVEKLFGAEPAKQPFHALVNVALPTESRILKAPLALEAGGWGQITRNGWSGTNDPGYQKMLRLVRASITPMKVHDIDGTCGRPAQNKGGCACGCCWVRQARAARRKRHVAALPQARSAK